MCENMYICFLVITATKNVIFVGDHEIICFFHFSKIKQNQPA